MPFCVIKSKTLKIFCAAIVVAIMLCISFNGSASAMVWFGKSTRLVPIYNVQTSEKQVAISFDAAWGADKTEEILEVLTDYNATATFFLVGFWAEKYPDETKKIADAGMEIGTHSNTHPDMVKLSSETMKSELTSSIENINSITGKEIKLFRPPFGSYNNTLINVCDELKLKVIQWDVDSLDWKGLSAGQICQRVTSKVKNGSIILMHNNSDNILDALRLTLNRLKVAGYKVTAIYLIFGYLM